MTYKRFHRIMNGRSYTTTTYQPNVPDTLRISRDKMIVFNLIK